MGKIQSQVATGVTVKIDGGLRLLSSKGLWFLKAGFKTTNVLTVVISAL